MRRRGETPHKKNAKKLGPPVTWEPSSVELCRETISGTGITRINFGFALWTAELMLTFETYERYPNKFLYTSFLRVNDAQWRLFDRALTFIRYLAEEGPQEPWVEEWLLLIDEEWEFRRARGDYPKFPYWGKKMLVERYREKFQPYLRRKRTVYVEKDK